MTMANGNDTKWICNSDMVRLDELYHHIAKIMTL